MMLKKIAGVSCAALFLVACGEDDPQEQTPQTGTLDLSLSGLEDLGADYVYEGWLIVDGAPISTGRFEDPTVMQSSEVALADAEKATAFVLTIEPAVGDDPAPADTHVVAGGITGQAAALGVDHMAALGTDFTSAAGNYILETPTTASIDADHASGIWWLDPSGPAASLDLPDLPAGWVYEGWVVGPNGPISTGRFTDPAAADMDGAGPDAGPDGAPPFPGQDFIDPPLDLSTGYKAVITVEPEPDNSPMPFAMKPLVDDIVDMGRAGAQDMQNNALATNPTGTCSIK